MRLHHNVIAPLAKHRHPLHRRQQHFPGDGLPSSQNVFALGAAVLADALIQCVNGFSCGLKRDHDLRLTGAVHPLDQLRQAPFHLCLICFNLRRCCRFLGSAGCSARAVAEEDQPQPQKPRQNQQAGGPLQSARKPLCIQFHSMAS